MSGSEEQSGFQHHGRLSNWVAETSIATTTVVVVVQTQIRSTEHLSMDSQIDLTAESDGDDADLQEAIRASLSGTVDVGGGGGGSGCGGSATSDNSESCRNITECTSQRHTAGKQRDRVPAEHERKGKRPRGKKEDTRKPSAQASFLFRLISTPTDKAGSGSVSLADLLSGDFQEALLTNYMVDIQLLLEAQPRLASVPVVLVHGFKDNS